MNIEILAHTPQPIEVIYRAFKQCYAAGKVEDIKIPTHKEMKEFICKWMDKEHCYDGETEVLTENGFVKWKNVNSTHKIASINPKDRSFLGFEKPLELIKEKYNGKMIHFLNNQIDLLVTPNHKIYCSLNKSEHRRNKPIFELRYANEYVKDKYPKCLYKKPLRMVQSAVNQQQGENKDDYKYALYGFFIGDGHSKTKNTISFHIKKERKIIFLKRICKELNLTLKENSNNNFVIKFENIGEEFRKMFYNNFKEKTFPTAFYKMTQNQFRLFIEGLKNSDGSIKRNTFVYYTTSKDLLNKIQALCSINDLTTTYSKGETRVYRINIGSKRNKYPMFNDSRNPKNVFEKDYNGYIYCARVSKGLLVIRRNGKIVLSGNSSPLEHVYFTFSITGTSRVNQQQLTRHRHASFNIQSQRYVEGENFDFVIPKLDYIKDETEKHVAEAYIKTILKMSLADYKLLRDLGVKKEDARYILPLASTGNMIMTMNLRELRHFWRERLCIHAQWEIREMAQMIKEKVEEIVPFASRNCMKCNTCGECKNNV